jgi:hypothetical protein
LLQVCPEGCGNLVEVPVVAEHERRVGEWELQGERLLFVAARNSRLHLVAVGARSLFQQDRCERGEDALSPLVFEILPLSGEAIVRHAIVPCCEA